jgi:hypothetical protein
MKRDQLTPEARRQLAIAAEQLYAAGISIDEEAILAAASPPIVMAPRVPYVDADEWRATPAPRNRHERRRAAALSRRS